MQGGMSGINRRDGRGGVHVTGGEPDSGMLPGFLEANELADADSDDDIVDPEHPENRFPNVNPTPKRIHN